MYAHLLPSIAEAPAPPSISWMVFYSNATRLAAAAAAAALPVLLYGLLS